MKSSTLRANSISTLLRASLAAGLVVGAALAHAAPGFTVQARDQQLVKVGMTQDDVRTALGKPARNQNFRFASTTTWTYHRPDGESVFEIDFDKDGRVTATGERRVQLD